MLPDYTARAEQVVRDMAQLDARMARAKARAARLHVAAFAAAGGPPSGGGGGGGGGAPHTR